MRPGIGLLLVLLVSPLATADSPLPIVRRLPSQLAFSPEGTLLAAVAGDSTVWISELPTGRYPLTLGHRTSAYHSLAFSPNGKILALGTSDGIELWSLADGKPQGAAWKGHAGIVAALAYSPDGCWLASGGYDGSVRLWDTATGKPSHVLKSHKGRVTTLGFSGDGRWLASGGLTVEPIGLGAGLNSVVGDRVRLWEVATGRLLHTQNQRGQSLAVLGDRLVSGGPCILLGSPAAALVVNGTSVAYDEAVAVESAFARGRSYELRQEGGQVAATPDGRYFATAPRSHVHQSGFMNTLTLARYRDTGSRVRIRESLTGQLVWDEAAPSAVMIAFSPNGQTLAIATTGGTIQHRFWHRQRLAEGKPIEPAAAWDALQGDAVTALRAIASLSDHPNSVDLLRHRLKPVPVPEPRRIQQLIGELDHARYTVRMAAVRGLEEYGRAVEHPLRDRLQRDPSPEMARLIERLLTTMSNQSLSPELVRSLRAVQVLERSPRAEARELLRLLANGAADAELTREARQALSRLGNPTRP